ncbi:hypothetical protein PFISCL1PPCAC_6696, partial [Pristionchus fissidentatus]
RAAIRKELRLDCIHLTHNLAVAESERIKAKEELARCIKSRINLEAENKKQAEELNILKDKTITDRDSQLVEMEKKIRDLEEDKKKKGEEMEKMREELARFTLSAEKEKTTENGKERRETDNALINGVKIKKEVQMEE